MRRSRGPLWSHRDFLKLWAGQTISEFGSQVSQLAIPAVAVLTLKASPFQVAALGTVEFLPFLLFTLPAGVWVDRWRRRWILVAGDLGRAVLLASIPLAYLTGHLSLTQLYVVGFLVGIHTVFFDVAYQSYLPQLVDRETLVEGNSKLQMTVSGAAIVGPGVSGGLIALFTAPYAVLVDACSFLVSGGFTAAIHKREDPPPATDAAGCSWSCGRGSGTWSSTAAFPAGDLYGHLELLLERPLRRVLRLRGPESPHVPALMGLIGALGASAGSSGP